MHENIEIDVIKDLGTLKSIKDEWDTLNLCSKDGSPFSSHDWITAWCENYLDRNKLFVVQARKDGKLIGLLPFYITSKLNLTIIQLLGLKEVNGECVNLIIKQGLENKVGPLILDTLFELPENWDAISLYGIRTNSLFHNILFSTNSKLLQNTKIVSSMLGPARVIHLSESWEEFLKSRTKNFRKIYRRKISAFNDTGFNIVRESEGKNHEEVVDHLIQVESLSWQGIKGRPIIKLKKKFFDKIMPKLIKNNEADIIWAMNNEREISFILLFILKDRAFFFVTAYESAYEKFSLGTVVHYFALKHLCERGIKYVDLMIDIGPSTTKDRWTKTKEISMKHLFFKKTLKGRLAALSQIL